MPRARRWHYPGPALIATAAITIVTPCLNREHMLGDAIESLRRQDDLPVQHIVVDGGSTDNSVALARSLGADIIAAPSSSIYQAINLGIARANAPIVGLLNTDDRYRPLALSKALDALAKNPSAEILRGQAIQVSSDWSPLPHQGSSPFTLRQVLFGPANINACFFRAETFQRRGLFDETLPISADREWLARALAQGAATGELNLVVYEYRAHDGSLTIGRRRSAEADWVLEHLRFAAHLLDDPVVPTANRRLVRSFLAKEAVHLAWLLAQRRAGPTARRGLSDAFKALPTWPLMAPGAVLAALYRRARPEYIDTAGRPHE